MFLYPSSQGQDMETEKEADDQFIDGQSLGKKHKRKNSLTITQTKLTIINKLLQRIQNNKHQRNMFKGY